MKCGVVLNYDMEMNFFHCDGNLCGKNWLHPLFFFSFVFHFISSVPERSEYDGYNMKVHGGVTLV
jgi:hypothetical protein